MTSSPASSGSHRSGRLASQRRRKARTPASRDSWTQVIVSAASQAAITPDSSRVGLKESRNGRASR
ncbi:MAG: hypothetical protein ABSD40_20930 [Streptosporangiaceae bacterium]